MRRACRTGPLASHPFPNLVQRRGGGGQARRLCHCDPPPVAITTLLAQVRQHLAESGRTWPTLVQVWPIGQAWPNVDEIWPSLTPLSPITAELGECGPIWENSCANQPSLARFGRTCPKFTAFCHPAEFGQTRATCCRNWGKSGPSWSITKSGRPRPNLVKRGQLGCGDVSSACTTRERHTIRAELDPQVHRELAIPENSPRSMSHVRLLHADNFGTNAIELDHVGAGVRRLWSNLANIGPSSAAPYVQTPPKTPERIGAQSPRGFGQYCTVRRSPP